MSKTISVESSSLFQTKRPAGGSFRVLNHSLRWSRTASQSLLVSGERFDQVNEWSSEEWMAVFKSGMTGSNFQVKNSHLH
jgi:hypothetical protein